MPERDKSVSVCVIRGMRTQSCWQGNVDVKADVVSK